MVFLNFVVAETSVSYLTSHIMDSPTSDLSASSDDLSTHSDSNYDVEVEEELEGAVASVAFWRTAAISTGTTDHIEMNHSQTKNLCVITTGRSE